MAKDVTIDELIHIGCKMAQELQEYIDAADVTGPGSESAFTQAVLDKWNDIHMRSGLHWKNLAASIEDEPTLIDAL